jgi:cell division protein FtsB
MTLIRRPIMLLGPAVLLVVLLALATNVLPLRQIVAQRQELAATTSQLDRITAQNVMLDAKVAALETPVEVERLAREELGYVRPGEQAFVVMDPTPQTDPAPAATPGAAAGSEAGQPVDPNTADVQHSEPDETGLVGTVWNFMTGRDLADR